MKIVVLSLLLFFSKLSSAQSLNNYKYALVPEKFSIFKTKNKYRLNTLTKMYMQNFGFETYYDSEEQPKDFSNSNCNKVYLDLIENNTLFVTKIAVVIKDCKGTILATSNFATSREKNLDDAYTQVLREAFDNFVQLKNYKYKGEKVSEVVNVDPLATLVNIVDSTINENSQEQKLNSSNNQLFAQPIANGYQLIDSEPKIVLKIYNTSTKGVYTAVKGQIQGVFISKGGEWFFEYYSNDQLISEKINVTIN